MKIKKILSFLLFPFSWIYGLIVFVRNKLFDLGLLRETRFNIPVISVGNITVGGTGKTPHIEYLVSLLKNDFKLAVLSRGYKRKTKGFILADNYSDAGLIGDEPLQIKRKFPETEVAVDEDRCNGIRNLLKSGKPIDIILLDDAFQHRYVKPGLSVLLVDYSRPVTKDYLLPYGRLREPASGRYRADIVIISKSPATLQESDRQSIARDLKIADFQSLYFTTMVQNEIFPVFSSHQQEKIPAVNASSASILLVSGIANPRELKKFALNISPVIKEICYPDHHIFSKNDIAHIIHEFDALEGDEKILITTEKDAARLQKFSDLPENIKNKMFCLPVTVGFLNSDKEKFNTRIITYVKKNK